MMLRCGLPIDQIIGHLDQVDSNTHYQCALHHIWKAMQEGIPIYQAFARQHFFDRVHAD